MAHRLESIILLVASLLLVQACSRDFDVRGLLTEECAELGTVEYTCDLLFRNEPAKWESFKPGPRVILYSGKATVRAGIDISDDSAISSELSPDGRSISVTLPPARILSMSFDEKDIRREFEKVGFFRMSFDNDEKLIIRQKAEKELVEQLKGPNPSIPILKDAEANARSEVELILKATGRFDNVTVKIARDE